MTTQISPDAAAVTSDERKINLKIAACLFGGMLLLASLITRGLFAGGEPDPNNPGHDLPNVQSAFIGVIAAILLGAPILWDAAKGIMNGGKASGKARGAHMEVLIALAFIVAFANASYVIAGSVAFFMLIASFIEDRSAVGARRTIESLIRITPTRATLLLNGQEIESEAKDLKPGDRVLVRPGENIPADGFVRAGQSTVNQANITGESLPVEKNLNDEVFSGTINETGRLEIEVTRAGSDSTLGQVQKLILQAAETKPAVVRVLEQYAAFYTPSVLMIAFMVYFFTEDWDKVTSLLLIACPSAIVIAGPTAMVAALSAAARLGVLVKSVSDLEVARRINAIVFDKTGTLTRGELSVVRLRPADGIAAADLLKAAVTAEKDSRHPVARAVLSVAAKANIAPEASEKYEEIPGKGMAATALGVEILVGRQAFLEERGVDCSAVKTDDLEGLSLLFVASGGALMGVLALADTVRPTSAPAMEELEGLGVRRRVMITGDRMGPAKRVAAEVKVTHFEAEALPGDKLKLVESLQAQGYTVAVVGDGVNDGPALAAGDVSIAMGAAGSDVAIHSASIALMNNNLNRIPFLIRLSKSTISVIRQNLILVGIYILLMLVLLAANLLNPLVAALAHGILDLIVIFNSARLIREGEDVSDELTEVVVVARPKLVAVGA